jgi:hypothetical protein
VVGPALVYKLLQTFFGMSSAMPYYAVSISLFLTSAVLLFAYLRSRVGDWLALLAAVLILFLGAAFEDLLWAFQLGYFASAAAGLGMLLALDREDDHVCGGSSSFSRPPRFSLSGGWPGAIRPRVIRPRADTSTHPHSSCFSSSARACAGFASPDLRSLWQASVSSWRRSAGCL